MENQGREIVSTATQILTGDQLDLAIKKAEENFDVLVEQYKDAPTEIKNPLELAKSEAAWRAFRTPRLAAKNITSETFKDLREQLRVKEANCNLLVGKYEVEEDKHKAVIDAYKAHKEALKQAEAEAKAKRINGIKSRIQEFKDKPSLCVAYSSQTLQNEIDILSETTLDETEFAEYHIEAVEALNAAIDKLGDMMAAKLESERVAEENRISAQKLADARAAFEAEQAAFSADNARKAEIERKINVLYQKANSHGTSNSETLRAAIKELREVKLEGFDERLAEAEDARTTSVSNLCDILNAKVKQEQVAKEQKEKQDELDRQAQLISDQKAEAARLENERIEAGVEKIRAEKESRAQKKHDDEQMKQAQNYQTELDAMSAIEAFEIILQRNLTYKDQRISDICNNQIARLFEMIVVKKEEYDQLSDDQLFLNCLQGAGIDNCDAYECGQDAYNEAKKATV